MGQLRTPRQPRLVCRRALRQVDLDQYKDHDTPEFFHPLAPRSEILPCDEQSIHDLLQLLLQTNIPEFKLNTLDFEGNYAIHL